MKKTSFLFALLLLNSPIVYAMSSGSGKTLPLNDYAIGFEYNTIFNRDTEIETARRSDASIDGSDQFYGTLTYGLMDNGQYSASLLAKLGAADLTLKSTNATTSKSEILDYGQGFIWGLGGLVTYRSDREFNISLNGQYNKWSASLDGVVYDGQNATNIAGSPTVTVSEFQTALLFSKEIKTKRQGLTFVPYAGPSLSVIEIHAGDVSYRAGSFVSGTTDMSMKHDSNPFGIILGLEVYGFNDNLKLAIEARFLSEEALTLSIHYKF